jgi:hyperosmotically inducible periplasmic protein
MKRKLFVPLMTLAAFASSSAFLLHAQQGASPNADNTKVNKRDRAQGEPTADQGKNNLSDRDTMQKIRKSLMDDKSLSTYAHNVKVISQNGKVTLKGPVRSEEEKKSVERKAEDVAGSGNVTNEITIKAARVKNQ